jgi:hypothetical protein
MVNRHGVTVRLPRSRRATAIRSPPPPPRGRPIACKAVDLLSLARQLEPERGSSSEYGWTKPFHERNSTELASQKKRVAICFRGPPVPVILRTASWLCCAPCASPDPVIGSLAHRAWERFRSRTPGPPPFSSMNSTPAASKARRTARSFATVIVVSASASSARRTVVIPSLDSRARSSALQRRRARAARICALTSGFCPILTHMIPDGMFHTDRS